MLFAHSPGKLAEVELALRRAVLRHEAHLLTVSRIDHVFAGEAEKSVPEVAMFTLCQPQLYTALLAAEVRFSAFLPCRIAAVGRPDGVELHAVAPRDLCQLLNRPDLERLVAPLETLLREIVSEAALPQATAQAAQRSFHTSFGATEENISVHSTVPQRIDRRGTKVEELAGLGTHDSAGG